MSEQKISMIADQVQDQIDAVNTTLDKLIINPGDSVYFHVTTAGFVTNGTTGLFFMIPVNKIITATKATVVSMPLIAIRQNGKYVFGTTNTMNKINSHKANIEITNAGLSIFLSFSAADSTAINNAAAGIDVNITIRFD